MIQAGAELCQARAQVDLPAKAEFILTVEIQILNLQEKQSRFFVCLAILSYLGFLSFMSIYVHIFKNSKKGSSTSVELQSQKLRFGCYYIFTAF